MSTISRAVKWMVRPESAVSPGALAGDRDIDAVIAKIRSSCVTSASSGMFSSVSVSLVSSEAIISGSAAFLAPEIGMTPLSWFPPTIFILSI